MAGNIPRDMPPGRLPRGLVGESFELDLAALSERVTALESALQTNLQGLIVRDDSGSEVRAVQTITLSGATVTVGGSRQANVNTLTTVLDAGVLVGSQPAIEFIQGAGCTLTITEDSLNGKVSVQIDVP